MRGVNVACALLYTGIFQHEKKRQSHVPPTSPSHACPVCFLQGPCHLLYFICSVGAFCFPRIPALPLFPLVSTIKQLLLEGTLNTQGNKGCHLTQFCFPENLRHLGTGVTLVLFHCISPRRLKIFGSQDQQRCFYDPCATSLWVCSASVLSFSRLLGCLNSVQVVLGGKKNGVKSN